MNASSQSPLVVHYVMDPMCSWCFAFRAPWQAMRDSLDEHIEVRYVMGGLAPDSDAPMPESMRRAIEDTWRRIESDTGTRFNYDFWRSNTPRRSTYPACRAVIAAGFLAADGRAHMAEAVQRVYYLEARNPSLDETLIEAAESAGLDRDEFAREYAGERVQRAFADDLAQARRFGVGGFPAVIAEDSSQRPRYALVAAGYCDTDTLAARWQAVRAAFEQHRDIG